jgi:hypothetical protein
MAHHDTHEITSTEDQFEFTPELKRKLMIAAVIGVAMVALGAFLVSKGWNIGAWTSHEEAGAAHEGGKHGATLFSRIIANIWMNGVYFTGISVVGMFFMCYNYAAQSGWQAIIKRVPEAFPAFLPVTGIILLALFLYPDTRHVIFHWTHEGIMEKGSENYDKIIAGKSWWLNVPFWLIRFVFYFVAWFGLWKILRKNSLFEDEIGGIKLHDKSFFYAVVFLLVFGVTSSTSAWDLSMSIDTHWFSTMFGWYHLASWHVSGLAAMMLAILFLKDKGHLQAVNESHLQDLGKLIFGFSVFWAYVWFCQYLLIFYANLPEETIYYRERFTGYGGRYLAPFLLNFVFNFVLPFLVLMARKAKRTSTFLKLACVLILVGHWFDFYQMQMPGIAKEQGGIGIIEWGTTLVFVAGFIYSVANQLSKANLIPKNHPFLEESLHHDI